MRRESLRDTTGDPWNGRTLEWSTSSPPPAYNFAFTPIVHDRDAWYDMKKRGHVRPVAGFVPIHMPKNTGAGFVLAVLSAVCGFALIWHMWLARGRGVRRARSSRRSFTRSTTSATSTLPRTRSCAPRTLARNCWPAMADMTASVAPRRDGARRYRSTTPARITPRTGTLLGFWLYLMSDCLLFACLFASYGVLGRNYAGGPSGAELFELPLVAVNTALLLLSSITYGFAVIAMQRKRQGATLAWLAAHRACWAPDSSASSCTSSRT